MPNSPFGCSTVFAALHAVQHEHGYLAPEMIDAVADYLGLESIKVQEVATFYSMYETKPVGRNSISVCTNISCNLCGGDEVLEAFLEGTGTEMGEISADGRFTVIETECIGACGFVTPILIDDDFIESVTPAMIPELLARYP